MTDPAPPLCGSSVPDALVERWACTELLATERGRAAARDLLPIIDPRFKDVKACVETLGGVVRGEGRNVTVGRPGTDGGAPLTVNCWSNLVPKNGTTGVIGAVDGDTHRRYGRKKYDRLAGINTPECGPAQQVPRAPREGELEGAFRARRARIVTKNVPEIRCALPSGEMGALEAYELNREALFGVWRKVHRVVLEVDGYKREIVFDYLEDPGDGVGDSLNEMLVRAGMGFAFNLADQPGITERMIAAQVEAQGGLWDMLRYRRGLKITSFHPQRDEAEPVAAKEYVRVLNNTTQPPRPINLRDYALRQGRRLYRLSREDFWLPQTFSVQVYTHHGQTANRLAEGGIVSINLDRGGPVFGTAQPVRLVRVQADRTEELIDCVPAKGSVAHCPDGF